jgi:nitrite reductase/ring-hydroxylating ferredoxin subunit
VIVKILNENLPKDGEYKKFDYPEAKNEILIYKPNGRNYQIFSSFCPHFGGPLEIKNDKLHCHFHDYYFSIEDGSCLNRSMGAKCMLLQYFTEDDGLSVEI